MKKYCQPQAGFCFRYPASWTVLGEIFEGNGVVVAPEQTGDRAQWDGITVALVAPADENGEGPSLEAVIEKTAIAMREAGQNFETLQRRELTVDHSPAQMLKTRYRENATGRDWIEELAFLQDEENDVYSIALKCAPEHLAHLEPAMQSVLASWTAVPAPAPAEDAPSASPTPSAPHRLEQPR